MNKREFYLSQIEDYSLRDSLLDKSEELLHRSMVFTQLSTLSQQRVSNKSAIHSFNISKKTNKQANKQISMNPVSQYDLDTWGKGLILDGVPALVFQDWRDLIFILLLFFLIFIFNRAILSLWSIPFL